MLNCDIPPSPIFSAPNGSNKNIDRYKRPMQMIGGKGQDNTGRLEELIGNLPSNRVFIDEGNQQESV
jgi:hypothetical protein